MTIRLTRRTLLGSRSEPVPAPADQPFSISLPDGTSIACRRSHGRIGFPPLLLVHGMGSNMTRWSEFVDRASLQPDFGILRLDLRGHGASIRRDHLSMERWCTDLLGVLDANASQRAIVAGHSMGALIALWFAALYPERVAGLILIEPSFNASLTGAAARLRQWRWLVAVVARAVLVCNRVGLYRRQLPARNLWQWDQCARHNLIDAGRRDALIRLYNSAVVDLHYNSTAVYLQDLEQILRPPPHLRDVAAPSLTLMSSDTGYANCRITEQILSELPDNRIERLPATHWIMTEAPDAARTLIERWCRKLASAPSRREND